WDQTWLEVMTAFIAESNVPDSVSSPGSADSGLPGVPSPSNVSSWETALRKLRLLNFPVRDPERFLKRASMVPESREAESGLAADPLPEMVRLSTSTVESPPPPPEPVIVVQPTPATRAFPRSDSVGAGTSPLRP